MGTDQVPRSDVLMSVCCYPPFFCNMHKKVKKSAPAAVEGEHHSPDVEEGELQGSLAEVELQDILVVLLGPLHNPAVGVGLLHIQAVADVGVGLLHNQAVAVGVGLLHNRDLNHLQGIPVELLHIPDLQGHLDAPDEEPLDIPEEVLHFQGSPAVEVLHLQGMAERERLVGGPLPQDRLHQGNQTSVKLLVLQFTPFWKGDFSVTDLDFSRKMSCSAAFTNRCWTERHITVVVLIQTIL